MLRADDLWFVEEAADDPAELLKALPEIRQSLDPAPAEDDVGLRSLLEDPDQFAHRWWRDQARGSGRQHFSSKSHRAA